MARYTQFKHILSLSSIITGAKYFTVERNYQWIDEEMSSKAEFFDAWIYGIDLKNNTESSCVAIDPRGITKNLYIENCNDMKLTFVCKFQDTPDDICSDTIIEYEINDATLFVDNPPFEQCSKEQLSYRRASFEMDEVSKILSEMAICPIGEYINDWYEMACCVFGPKWWKVLLWTLMAVVFALILCCFLVFLDYIELITFDLKKFCRRIKRLRR